jgi:hypothetical protein
MDCVLRNFQYSTRRNSAVLWLLVFQHHIIITRWPQSWLFLTRHHTLSNQILIMLSHQDAGEGGRRGQAMSWTSWLHRKSLVTSSNCTVTRSLHCKLRQSN